MTNVINYHKELIKVFHPDLNNNSSHSKVITKIANKLRDEKNDNGLKNLYDRLVGLINND